MTGRQLLRLVLAQVCVHSAMTGARLAAPLLALKLGHSAAAVGVLLACYALSAVFLALPAGRLADRHGLHRPLAIAVAAAVLGAGMAALWPVFWVLCASALLLGAAANTAQIALQRHVGRSAADVAERKLAFSWIAIAPATANFVGPLAAGLLIDHAGPQPGDLLGYRAAFGLLALLPLVCWALLRRAPEALQAAPVQAPARQSVWDLLGQDAMRRLLIANWLQSAAWDAHTFVLPLLGHERGLEASAIGAMMGAFALAAALVRMALPLLARRFAEWQVIYATTLMAGAVLLAYPWMPGALGMGACSAILGATLGAVQPMVLSLLHDAAPPARQGEAMALRSLTMNSSSFALPMLFGSIGAVTGTAGLFFLVAAVLGLGARTVPGLARLPRRLQ
ncbi:MAG TPA: MFS transporter [Ottowia sp.]|uniref:MFS transporter n=1 Tax=Ottowia sp. TaxID=1898956 RepID=UPI002CC2D9C0|nr:MFS transporter [Ottowia sp.]HMN20703.1 MFS transporter [Ottowia sp.]